jgi:hypothetical protein
MCKSEGAFNGVSGCKVTTKSPSKSRKPLLGKKKRKFARVDSLDLLNGKTAQLSATKRGNTNGTHNF